MPWYALAAALVVVLVLAAGNVYQFLQGQTQRGQLATARHVVSCVNSQGCRAVPMRPPGGSEVPVTALVHQQRVRLVVQGLKVNDAANTTYVLWQQSGGSLRPVAAFDVTEREGTVIDGGRLGRSLQNTKLFAVSHEQGNTMPKQPSQPIAVGRVSS